MTICDLNSLEERGSFVIHSSLATNLAPQEIRAFEFHRISFAPEDTCHFGVVSIKVTLKSVVPWLWLLFFWQIPIYTLST